MAATAAKRTVSILSTLATLPSGKPSSPLTVEELSGYLAKHYKTEIEIERNRRHALRDELYRDGGVNYMNTVIDQLFADQDVRKLRKAVVPFARFNNALKRIVNEMSTVYSEPARRMVGELEPVDLATVVPPEGESVTPNDDRYQAVLRAVFMDERMAEVGRLLNLHRALLVAFRVRALPDGSREPVVDICTPANARAITHPNDDSLIIGWLVRASHKSARTTIDIPAWTLWTDYESVQLRDDLTVIPGTYDEHNLGVCPWVPITLGPAGSGFWPGSEGEDMVSGHLTIWLENVLLIKESKSATKQTVITGDGTTLARGQANDSEGTGELADGQSMNIIDRSMDLDLFKSTADHVLQHLAQNYGMSPALIQHQGVQSAEARELMRIPLKEIRRRQQTPFRRFEERFAIVMSAVLKVDLPSMYFEVIAWRCEFAESETPLDPNAEQTLFERRRAAGTDNTVAFLMRKYPGLTREGAWAMIKDNIVVEVERNVMMRPLMRISGSMGAKTPGAGDGNANADGSKPVAVADDQNAANPAATQASGDATPAE